MSKVTKIECPSCGGKLGERNSDGFYCCSYCGNQFLLSRPDESYSNLENKEISSTKKLASEMAIKRLQSEISELSAQKIPYLNEWNNLIKIHEQETKFKKNIKVCLIISIISFALLIFAVSADWMVLGMLSILSFLGSILFIILVGVSVGREKLSRRRYYKIADIMVPLENKIEKKRLEIEKYMMIIEGQ